MINHEEAILESIVLHRVGNKSEDDGIRFSKGPLKTDEAVNELLIRYFFSPFKQQEYYNLHHESDLNMNEVYRYVSEIFDDPESLYDRSVDLAKHLYENSEHPKIKRGEFYVVYFSDCVVDGELVDAVGLFKSESRETYLKVYARDDNFEINHDDGININKLDKGCLIFNSEKEKGFLVAVVDNLSKGSDARYWKDDFLQLVQRQDEFFHTNNVMQLCKQFVKEKLPGEFEVNKVDQADMLNKSATFLKENEKFNLDAFTSEVIQQPEVIESFKNYKEEYESEQDFHIADDFEISGAAAKKSSRFLRSVIKLDKNFHIYVHGNRENIEKGFDDTTGKHYYRLYFDQET